MTGPTGVIQMDVSDEDALYLRGIDFDGTERVHNDVARACRSGVDERWFRSVDEIQRERSRLSHELRIDSIDIGKSVGNCHT
ncbi:MAG: hypothetical protein V5A36_02030 [Natronomonas sp.]